MGSYSRRRSVPIRILAGTAAVCIALLVAYSAFAVWQMATTYNRGLKRYQAGDYAGAAVALKEFVDLNPDEADGHYWLGNAYGFSGRLEEAATHLERASHLEPKNEEVLRSLANVYGHLRRWDAALSTHERLAELSPRDARVWVAIGYAHARREGSGSGAGGLPECASVGCLAGRGA